MRLLAVLLLAWEPLNFAVRLLQVLPTLTYRGWLPVLELGVHAAVAMLTAVAGVAVWNRAPGCFRIAAMAVIASTARVLQSLFWTTLPTQIIPSDRPFYAAVAVLVAARVLYALRRWGWEQGQAG